jgi:hypothetical protein
MRCIQVRVVWNELLERPGGGRSWTGFFACLRSLLSCVLRVICERAVTDLDTRMT